jgi:hypothetical protein
MLSLQEQETGQVELPGWKLNLVTAQAFNLQRYPLLMDKGVRRERGTSQTLDLVDCQALFEGWPNRQ